MPSRSDNQKAIFPLKKKTRNTNSEQNEKQVENGHTLMFSFRSTEDKWEITKCLQGSFRYHNYIHSFLCENPT